MSSSPSSSPSTRIALSLFEKLKSIPDFRRKQGLRYPMESMLAIVFTAVLFGRSSLRGIVAFAEEIPKSDYALLGIKRAPSRGNVDRLIKNINISALELAICGWLRDIQGNIADRSLIAIDGKSLRGVDQKNGQKAMTISAYLVEHGIVLGQTRVIEGSSEPRSAIKMLESINIEKMVVTLDAIYTQKHITDQICGKNADYIMSVKGNQSELREECQLAFNDKKIEPELLAINSKEKTKVA